MKTLFWRFKNWMVAGKRGTFVCAQGLTHECVILGLTVDSPFYAINEGYRIDYVHHIGGEVVRNAEIPVSVFTPAKRGSVNAQKDFGFKITESKKSGLTPEKILAARRIFQG